ncbi:LOW QUALITY PROTEIN: hypothetical protein TorRG33x02_136430 [Trema orientale]|uniref:Uncharacterized protein n=1 Tax=Trema orientale TaxID=63057 RepID=A0A2P5EYH7_TREOI|nr:LOW QUALITY PROTEIN: hypothetical protein TorRG33x02_136430 [Trema orientale]
MLPLENVAVATVKRLILGSRIHRRPYLLLGDQVGIGGVPVRIPADPTARKLQRLPLMLTYGRVNTEAAYDVDQTVRRESEYGTRPVNRPRQALLLLHLRHNVLQSVIKVGYVQPREVFVERGLVGRELAPKLERAGVVLPARLQAHVLEIRSVRGNRFENVAEHPGVDMAVLELGGLAAPGDVEDVGDISELGELGPGLVPVGEVALNVVDGAVGVPGGAGAAGDAVDLPGSAGGVGEGEDLGEAVADNAGDADDQGYTLVIGRCGVVIVSFLLLN